ncbi:MAG: Phosphoribosylanthranilate isomerase [Acidobacteria bacterium]|nr:Phosphoribosylanthranilate isomerase [Acidobacteriota bacterium]
MGVVQIKICGMRRADEVDAAVEAGVDLLGFNFWPGTSRYIPPEEAAPLVRSVPGHIWTVGVFVDEKPERVLEIAALTGVTVLQFHGNESPEYMDRLNLLRSIKAFKVGNDFRPDELGRYPSAYAFLLDGWVAGGLPGGTGQVFDWSRAQQAHAYGKIIVAGGLTARNVAEAIRRAQPWGVDVCSGVESVPGKKDPKLVREFIHAAREAEQQVPVRELDTRVRLRQTRPAS